MKDSVLDRYTAARPTKHPADAVEPSDSPDDFGTFGVLRGIRERAMCLELRMKDGRIAAFSYAYLFRAEFDPDDGIRLHFGGSPVHIAGRNLNAEVRPNLRLFGAITQHRVLWIAESTGAASLLATPIDVVVDMIDVQKA